MGFGRLGLILAATVGLAACGGSTQLSTNKTPTDNSQTYVNPPLSVPPGYNAPPLAAPASTGASTSSGASGAQTQVALSTGASAADSASSPAETPGVDAFLKEAGANKANPNIRAEIDRTASNQARANEALMDKLIFGTKPPALPAGTAPTIKRSSPGLLDSIL
jgi:hypothetical protein